MLDVRHRLHKGLGVAADPPVRDEADRHGIEEVELATAVAAGEHEVRILEHPQVLHDAEASHLRQCRLELAQRLAVSFAKPIEQRAPMRIGERPKRRLQLFHHQPDNT